MKINYRVLVLLTFFLPFVVSAQEKRSLSLNEAIDLGIKNSKQLKTSQARIEEAAAALQEAIEKKLPSASASASYLRLNSANFDLKSSNNNGGNGNNAPRVNDMVYGMVNLSLPIYNGGRIRYGIESARFLKKATELDAEANKDEVIQNTIEAFANLFKAGTAVTLVKENLLQAQQRVKELANLEKNGLLARNDLLKAELQASNVELNLLDAENNLQFANLNMNIMLGLPENMILVPDTSNIDRKSDPRVLEDYVSAALENRKDKAAGDYRIQAALSSVKTVKAEALPGVQLTGGYIAADIPKVLTVTNAVNIGLGLSYNIASLWKNKSKLKQAQSRVEQMRLGESILEDNIRLQVNRNFMSLESSRKKIEVQARAFEQATENYRIVKNKFDNGLATMQELLDADISLLQSRLSYTLAKADAFVAYNKLLQTAGILSKDLKK